MTKRTPRCYNSPIRKRQAEETRNRILDAARVLLGRKGFDGTTMDAIADAARVSSPTVYAIFGSKKGVVAELLERARFGPAFEALVERAMTTEDPAERLAFAARISRQIYDSERAELEVLRGAGVVCPELAELERTDESCRFEAQAHLVGYLAESGRLRDGYDVPAARDVLWTLTGRDLYRMLVVERGWSSARYEAWLAKTLARALLAT